MVRSNFPDHWKTRKVWFPGYTYNATPGSRAAFSNPATDTIRNGYVFCFDPEALIDVASLPAGMVLNGSGENRRMINVTKPATGILGMFAGVVVNAPPAGLSPLNTRFAATPGYLGGIELELAYDGLEVPCLTLGDFSSTAFGTNLGPTNAQWYLGITALGTNGVGIPEMVGFPMVKENVASAAVKPCYLHGR